MIACVTALGAKGGRLWTLLSKSTTTIFVRAVAANWRLGTRLKVPQPDHSLIFFDAKTAATFVQLYAGLLRCASSQPDGALAATKRKSFH
jgi:hypothetical protein